MNILRVRIHIHKRASILIRIPSITNPVCLEKIFRVPFLLVSSLLLVNKASNINLVFEIQMQIQLLLTTVEHLGIKLISFFFSHKHPPISGSVILRGGKMSSP